MHWILKVYRVYLSCAPVFCLSFKVAYPFKNHWGILWDWISTLSLPHLFLSVGNVFHFSVGEPLSSGTSMPRPCTLVWVDGQLAGEKVEELVFSCVSVQSLRTIACFRRTGRMHRPSMTSSSQRWFLCENAITDSIWCCRTMGNNPWVQP